MRDQPIKPQPDPQKRPSSAGGWSESLTSVPNALFHHADSGINRPLQRAGVFDAQGLYVPQGAHWRGRALSVPFEGLPEPVETLKGRWLWGGRLQRQFGHFLMESLGRLWAVEEGSFDGIAFVYEAGFQPEAGPHELTAWQRRILDLLGISLPVRILHAPTRFEELVVPGQGLGVGVLDEGTARMRDFLRRRFAPDIAPEGGELLYISRSRLPARLGGIVRESTLERQLAAYGYEVFHPQEHPLEVQIARYRAARKVISVDGSALHCLALTAQRDCQIAMVLRRFSASPGAIARNIEGFVGRPPLILDQILRSWERSGRRIVDAYSFGEVDFAALGRDLAAAGFLEPGQSLKSLPWHRVIDFIERQEIKSESRASTFTPRDRDGALVPRRAISPKIRERFARAKAARKANREAGEA